MTTKTDITTAANVDRFVLAQQQISKKLQNVMPAGYSEKHKLDLEALTAMVKSTGEKMPSAYTVTEILAQHIAYQHNEDKVREQLKRLGAQAENIATSMLRIARRHCGDDNLLNLDSWQAELERAEINCVRKLTLLGELPRAWIQAKSDIKGAANAGVDIGNTNWKSLSKIRQEKARLNALKEHSKEKRIVNEMALKAQAERYQFSEEIKPVVVSVAKLYDSIPNDKIEREFRDELLSLHAKYRDKLQRLLAMAEKERKKASQAGVVNPDKAHGDVKTVAVTKTKGKAPRKGKRKAA